MIGADRVKNLLNPTMISVAKRTWALCVICLVLFLLAAIRWQSVDAQQRRTLQARIMDPLATAPIVGPNANISRTNAGLAHTEILVAADNNNPQGLLVGTMIWRSERNALSSGVYASSDGGRSWKLTLEDTTANLVWDPACAFGKNGSAFFAAISQHGVHDRRDSIDFYRSNDAGRTWSAPVRAPFADREYITVDQTGGKFDGRIYLYMAGDPAAAYDASARSNSKIQMELFTTTDGMTFQGPATGPNPASLHRRLAVAGPGVVMDDGTFLAPYLTQPSPPTGAASSAPTSRIEVLSSSDGGATVSEPQVVTQLNSAEGIQERSGIYRAMEIDHSKGPFHGRVYLVWDDIRSRRCSILIAHSDDGKTWSQPVVVDDVLDRPPARGPDSFLPSIAVNRNGVVGVTWYDRREDPLNRNFRLRFSASFDGGETFTPSVPVSERSFLYSVAEAYQLNALAYRSPGNDDAFRTGVANAPRTYYGVGETAGLATTPDGVFHAFWLDNRTGVEQIYTAEVRTNERAWRNGSPSLAVLENVRRECEVAYTKTAYDPVNHLVTLSMRITNTSKQAIVGPIKLRATSLQSVLGKPLAMKTENGVQGPGAVWDLSGLLINGRLEPGATSSTGKLTFKIVDFRPLLGDRERSGNVIQFDSKLYGRREPAATEKQ